MDTTNTTTKTCNRCGDEKPIEEFPVRKGRLLHQCKVCTAAASRERRRRLEDKRADALSAEHERCGIHTPEDGEFFKDFERRLKRNEAQKRYRAKAKAKKASRPRTDEEPTEKLEETRAKIDKWTRMYVVATIGPQMCRQTALDNHNAFSVVSIDLLWQAERYWRQKYDIVRWLRRYLPENTVDLILRAALADENSLEAARQYLKDGWKMDAERREREREARAEASRVEQAAWQEKYDALPSDLTDAERRIRVNYGTEVPTDGGEFVMPSNKTPPVVIPDEPFSATNEAWMEVVGVVWLREEAPSYLLELVPDCPRSNVVIKVAARMTDVEKTRFYDHQEWRKEQQRAKDAKYGAIRDRPLA